MENYFYKKYEPINWKDDGTVILNKIGNNLTSRFESMNFEIVDDVDGFRIEITQRGSYCSLWWSFNDETLVAQLETSGGIPVKDMDAVETEIQECGIVKESKNNEEDMKTIKTFESFVNEMMLDPSIRAMAHKARKEKADKEAGSKSSSEEKCDCGKCSKEDCKCGPDCGCEDCKEKHGNKE